MKGTVLVVVIGLLFACVPGVQADEHHRPRGGSV